MHVSSSVDAVQVACSPYRFFYEPMNGLTSGSQVCWNGVDIAGVTIVIN